MLTIHSKAEKNIKVLSKVFFRHFSLYEIVHSGELTGDKKIIGDDVHQKSPAGPELRTLQLHGQCPRHPWPRGRFNIKVFNFDLKIVKDKSIKCI